MCWLLDEIHDGKRRRFEQVSRVHGNIHDKIKLLMIFQSFVYCINNCWRPTEKKNQKQVHTRKFADAEVEESVPISSKIILLTHTELRMDTMATRTETSTEQIVQMTSSITNKMQSYTMVFTRWFKYDRDWFVCKQAALRSSCATLREWSHNFHPTSCSG